MEIKQEQENEKVMLQGELSPGDQRPRGPGARVARVCS
jgi:hypothetical protein